MASSKVAFLVAVLALCAAFVVAEAHEGEHDGWHGKPDKISLKVILHNMASRDVTFRNLNFLNYTNDVLVKKNEWSAIEPVDVTFKDPVMRLTVTTKRNDGTIRTKLLQLDLVHYYKKSLKGKKYIVLTAVESWKKKFLFVKLDGQIIRIVKL